MDNLSMLQLLANAAAAMESAKEYFTVTANAREKCASENLAQALYSTYAVIHDLSASWKERPTK